MKTANTLISSKVGIIGERICEVCGSKVLILKVKKDSEDREVSDCLTCETNKIQNQCQKLYEEAEENINLSVFKKHSIIPDDLKKARFATYKPDHTSKHEAKSIAIKYVKNFDKIKAGESNFQSLIFQGSYGLGKSHLSHAIAEEVLRKGHSVLFIDMPQMLQFFRNNIQSKELGEAKIMSIISRVDLLVLDDLGAEYIKKENGKESWAVDKLIQILNMRTNKPNILTTNYNSRGLEEKYGVYGGRIVSRLMMGTKAVKLEGSDYRIQKF